MGGLARRGGRLLRRGGPYLARSSRRLDGSVVKCPDEPDGLAWRSAQRFDSERIGKFLHDPQSAPRRFVRFWPSDGRHPSPAVGHLDQDLASRQFHRHREVGHGVPNAICCELGHHDRDLVDNLTRRVAKLTNHEVSSARDGRRRVRERPLILHRSMSKPSDRPLAWIIRRRSAEPTVGVGRSRSSI